MSAQKEEGGRPMSGVSASSDAGLTDPNRERYSFKSPADSNGIPWAFNPLSQTHSVLLIANRDIRSPFQQGIGTV